MFLQDTEDRSNDAENWGGNYILKYIQTEQIYLKLK